MKEPSVDEIEDLAAAWKAKHEAIRAEVEAAKEAARQAEAQEAERARALREMRDRTTSTVCEVARELGTPSIDNSFGLVTTTSVTEKDRSMIIGLRHVASGMVMSIGWLMQEQLGLWLDTRDENIRERSHFVFERGVIPTAPQLKAEILRLFIRGTRKPNG